MTEEERAARRVERSLKSLPSRYWPNVEKNTEGGCWLWMAGKFTDGYGVIGVCGKVKVATHVAWFFAHGIWPNRGQMVCHTCDTPSCVNPAHLFLGNAAINNADRHRKGRTVLKPCPPEKRARGEGNGSSKLRDQDVRDIRASSLKPGACAKKYGVGRNAITLIRSGKRWAHVLPECGEAKG